ncbi:unnamed protein product [Closterium sp. Naga37s-1]|nr:unnamed protein product [Closterium sp. Naga37s-1]
MSTAGATPISGSRDPNVASASGSTECLQEDSTHIVFKYSKVPIRPDCVGVVRICKYCNLEFKGGAFRCAQHLAKWKGLKSRDVRLCSKVPFDVRAAVRTHYERKQNGREDKRRAEDAALAAVSGGSKKGRTTDFLGDEKTCKTQAAHESICLLSTDLRLPEHHTDHSLWRNAAKILLINEPAAVFTECVDCKMESKTGGYIADMLHPIIEKVGPDNVVALCMDGGSNYATACNTLVLEWPHIEVVPCATHVMDKEWWKCAAYFVELLKLPFVVLHATDSTAKGMMGLIYDRMLQLTEDINAKLEKGEGVLTMAEKSEVGNIVRRHWDGSLACAMHVVGRILNPANQEEGIVRNDVECKRIPKSFITHHFEGKTVIRKDGEERRASLAQEGLTAFLNLEGPFGLPEAIADKEAMKAGNIPEPLVPERYKEIEEGEEEEGADDVLADEYVE